MSNLENQIPSIPAHHVHKDNEPLPGAKGAAPTVDYSAPTIERVAHDNSLNNTTAVEQGDFHTAAANEREPRRFAHGAEIPDTQEPFKKAEGVGAHGEHEQKHGVEKKAGAGDKIVGKAQALAGKITKNEGLQEKGAVRAEVGKSGSV